MKQHCLLSTYFWGKMRDKNGGKKIAYRNNRLNYQFVLEPLESTVYNVRGIKYSMTQLTMNLSRTDEARQKIFVGYHAPTAIFALLSLLSYFIDPDVVPGRMGMLLLLYLILLSTYNAVDAPSRRGFSLIETWFIGTQVPILTAIIQYGIVLAIKKFFQPKNKQVWNRIDFVTFIISLTFFTIFNIFYWHI